MEEQFSLIFTLLVLLLALRNIFRKRPRGERQEAPKPQEAPFEPFNPFGPQGPFGSFNPFDRPEQPPQPRKPKAARKAAKPQAAPAAAPIPHEAPVREAAPENPAEEFDLRRAIIYSEILKPKFTEEEV